MLGVLPIDKCLKIHILVKKLSVNYYLTGFGVQGSLTSQRGPVNPGWQEHIKLLPCAMQCPLFSHYFTILLYIL